MDKLLLVAVMFALLQAACGKSEKKGDAGSTKTPSTSVPATGGTARIWTAVTEVVAFCDYPVCSGSAGFTVLSDGRYRIGDGSVGSGNVTAAELAGFAVAADAAAEQVSATLNCARNPPLIGASRFELSLVFNDQSVWQLLHITKQSSCYFGDVQLADALHLRMRELELKYDPRSIGPGRT